MKFDLSEFMKQKINNEWGKWVGRVRTKNGPNLFKTLKRTTNASKQSPKFYVRPLC